MAATLEEKYENENDDLISPAQLRTLLHRLRNEQSEKELSDEDLDRLINEQTCDLLNLVEDCKQPDAIAHFAKLYAEDVSALDTFDDVLDRLG